MTPLCFASSFDGLLILEEGGDFGFFEDMSIESIQYIIDGRLEQFLVVP